MSICRRLLGHIGVAITPMTHLVNDEQVRLRDTRATLARNLVSALHVGRHQHQKMVHIIGRLGQSVTHRDVNDVDDVVRELARIIRSEVVTAALDEEKLAAILRLERFERTHVRADVLADRGVWAATGLDRENTRLGQGLVLDQKFLVLAREDVVRDTC